MKTLFKLIFDDPRLVSVLLAFLLLAGVFTLSHQPILVAVSIWVGLPAALLSAVLYPLKKALRSE